MNRDEDIRKHLSRPCARLQRPGEVLRRQGAAPTPASLDAALAQDAGQAKVDRQS